MPLDTVDERVAYIQGLDVHQWQATASDSVVDTTGTSGSADGHHVSGRAYVVGGSNISFATGAGDNDDDIQLQNDVLHSTCLAQVVADTKYPGRLVDQREQWYAAYIEVLEQIGWYAEKASVHELSDVNGCRSVDRLIGVFITGDMIEGPLLETMNALKEPSNAAALYVFDSAAKDATQAGFQLGVVYGRQGGAELRMRMYNYSASEDIPSALFLEFGSQEMKFFIGKQTLYLDADAYSEVREDVIKKLGNYIQEYIRVVELPEY